FYLERGKKDQAFFQALYVQAFLHYQLGEFSQAEQQLLRIVGDRNHSEVCLHAYNLLAQVYREISSQQNNSHKRREILNRGKKILAKAILEYPNHPILLNTMGVIYDELGNKARAKEYFVAAQAADPFCLFSYLNLVDLQLDYQRKEEAEVELQKLQVKIKEMLENRQHMPEILKIDFYVFMKEIIQRTQSRAAQEILESIFSSPYGGKARKLFQMAKGPIQSNS
ncbi:MAG: tetratricopeptide repeat protein, partial [Candidatus Margulisiibacteriota bacterium]